MNLKGKIANGVILTIGGLAVLLLIIGTIGRLWNAAHDIPPAPKPVQQEQGR